MGDTLLKQASFITIPADKLFLHYPLVYSLLNASLYYGWSTIQFKHQAHTVAGVLFNLNARSMLWLEYYSI